MRSEAAVRDSDSGIIPLESRVKNFPVNESFGKEQRAKNDTSLTRGVTGGKLEEEEEPLETTRECLEKRSER